MKKVWWIANCVFLSFTYKAEIGDTNTGMYSVHCTNLINNQFKQK